MKVFLEHPKARVPEYATTGSACFDLRACFDYEERVRAYNPHNREIMLPVRQFGGCQQPAIQIHPLYRVLIPTGLIFDIPEGHDVEVNIRSSLAFKHGLTLANATAIVDSDYVQQTYVLVYNMSDAVITVQHDERIAQAKLIKLCEDRVLEETTERPTQKTDRTGGVGSTGTS